MRPVEHARPRGRRLMQAAALALTCWALAVSGAAAQTAWETPRFLAPQAIGGTGLYYVRYAALPGDGQGGFVVWSPPSRRGISLRLGAAEGAGGVTAGFGGVEMSAPIAERTEARPIDVSWNAGAGVAVGEYLLVSVPVGLAAGRAWESGPVWLSPYVGVRAAMDLRLGDEAPTEEFEVSPGMDVGLDAAFDRGRTVILRLSTSLGDRSALAIGLVIGG